MKKLALATAFPARVFLCLLALSLFPARGPLNAAPALAGETVVYDDAAAVTGNALQNAPPFLPGPPGPIVCFPAQPPALRLSATR